MKKRFFSGIEERKLDCLVVAVVLFSSLGFVEDVLSMEHEAWEKKWNSRWDSAGIYRYDPAVSREHTYIVDTPPPTVSGNLHVGHMFSYTQTDIQVRYRRMQGMNILYPIGWDDNGLPTERRVQNFFGIKCNPSLPYDPSLELKPVDSASKSSMKEVSRRNFIEACAMLAQIDEKKFEELFRSIGHSYDWNFKYATIDNGSMFASQLSFLDLVKKGVVYTKETPHMWDITFQSAVANAEIVDREQKGAFFHIGFKCEDGSDFVIATTRPELLSACIGIVANPSDERYVHLFGKKAITPGFYAPVGIYPADYVQPEKGTGIMMVCTFGDAMDVEWWKKSGLPMKQIIGKDGRIFDVDYGVGVFESVDPKKSRENFSQLIGLDIERARMRTVDILKAEGALKDVKGIVHSVKYYEKGDRPIEFIPTRQWFINVLDFKEKLLEQGRKIEWHPTNMRERYESWVKNLNQDWCISRQRYFGIPFPVWYPLNKAGEIEFDTPIFATEDMLPLDPMITPPPGFSETQRNQSGGFISTPDVMDTWATSSVTPQIVARWGTEAPLHTIPIDLRTQAHEIIRTWAFYTIVKSFFHSNDIPWRHICVSGYVTDSHKEKMSKSSGNVVTPEALIKQYSADGVRYWAGKSKLGQDTIYNPQAFSVGKRLATKIFNVGRFVKTILDKSSTDISSTDILSSVSEVTDRMFLETLFDTVTLVKDSFEKYDYATALSLSEELFWKYCDYYVELVKGRAYNSPEKSAAKMSAMSSLLTSTRTFLLLFAPIMPYVTEEVWSVLFPDAQSIHRTAWPVGGMPKSTLMEAFPIVQKIMSDVRAVKSREKKAMSWPVKQMKVFADSKWLPILSQMRNDIASSCKVEDSALEFIEAESVHCEVVLQ